MSTTTSAPVIPDKELSDDEIMLTDAERAAMDEDNDGEGEPEAAEEPAEPAQDAAPKGEAAEAPAEPEQAPARALSPAPVLQPADTAEAESRRAEIQEAMNKIAADFDDGEFTAAEMRARLAPLEAEDRKLEWSINEADLARRMNEQAATNSWMNDVGTFLDEKKDVLRPGSLVLEAYDLAVRKVNGDTAHDHLTNRQRLQMAYDTMTAEFGMGATPTPNNKPAAPPAAPRPALPPSIANAPQAAVGGTDDGKFASLDRMMDTDPLGYEAALERMPDSERESYLMSR